MRFVALLVVLVASALSGCTGGEGLGLGGGADDEREPYYKEWRSFVDGSHLMVYDVPVEAGATTLNVSVVLDPRTNGMPLPDLVLARLDLSLSDPSGAPLLHAEVDVQHRSASLVLSEPAPGRYVVQVSGVGTSQEIDGTRYGDAYTLSAEVLYS